VLPFYQQTGKITIPKPVGNEVVPPPKALAIFKFLKTTLIISKKPGNTGISRDIRTEFTTDLLLSD
jgi:hypothetical protein